MRPGRSCALSVAVAGEPEPRRGGAAGHGPGDHPFPRGSRAGLFGRGAGDWSSFAFQMGDCAELGFGGAGGEHLNTSAF